MRTTYENVIYINDQKRARIGSTESGEGVVELRKFKKMWSFRYMIVGKTGQPTLKTKPHNRIEFIVPRR